MQINRKEIFLSSNTQPILYERVVHSTIPSLQLKRCRHTRITISLHTSAFSVTLNQLCFGSYVVIYIIVLNN